MENKKIEALRDKCLLHKCLRRALNEKGMTFRHLSQKSGVPIKTLYHWAAGQMPGNILQVYSVALVLGMTVEQLLFDGIESPKGLAYELVLYRIDENHIRQEVASLQKR